MQPWDYVSQREDIEMVVPKFESFFNQCNRIPACGRFEDDFNKNVQTLADSIHSVIQEELGQQDEAAYEADAEMASALKLRSDSGGVEEGEAAEQEEEGFKKMVMALRDEHTAKSAAGNIRFMTRRAENRLLLRKVGAVEALCAVLQHVVQNESVSQAGSTLEHILVSLRNMTGAPDDLGLSGYVRWQHGDQPVIRLIRSRAVLLDWPHNQIQIIIHGNATLGMHMSLVMQAQFR